MTGCLLRFSASKPRQIRPRRKWPKRPKKRRSCTSSYPSRRRSWRTARTSSRSMGPCLLTCKSSALRQSRPGRTWPRQQRRRRLSNSSLSGRLMSWLRARMPCWRYVSSHAVLQEIPPRHSSILGRTTRRVNTPRELAPPLRCRELQRLWSMRRHRATRRLCGAPLEGSSGGGCPHQSAQTCRPRAACHSTLATPYSVASRMTWIRQSRTGSQSPLYPASSPTAPRRRHRCGTRSALRPLRSYPRSSQGADMHCLTCGWAAIHVSAWQAGMPNTK
mmetsp:Transcript_8991/g.25840  ORF Transcript_8991/g.25840 Transcript_8991/m.25840 type:complete len:275 (+) Transcript_8991:2189-3013(+)